MWRFRGRKGLFAQGLAHDNWAEAGQVLNPTALLTSGGSVAQTQMDPWLRSTLALVQSGGSLA